MSGHGTKNVVQPFGDRGEPKVSCAFASSNSGSVVENTAIVKNSLSLNFHDGRIRFLMRRNQGGYIVTGGDKLADYIYAKDSNTAIIVRVNINGKAETTVGISASTPEKQSGSAKQR